MSRKTNYVGQKRLRSSPWHVDPDVEIVCIAQAKGYVMVQRDRQTPYVMTAKAFAELEEARVRKDE